MTSNMNTAFHRSVWGGCGTDYAELATLVGDGADVNSYAPVGVPHGNYRTALAQGIFAHNSGLVIFLIEMGANVNQLTRQSGWFPLHCAVACNDRTMCDLLLRYGADPHARYEDSETPLEMATRMRRANLFA
jgi:hypothetical protein